MKPPRIYLMSALTLCLTALAMPVYAADQAEISAYFRAGVEHGRDNDYTGGIAYFDKVIVLMPAQPSDPGEAINLASAYYNRGTLKAKLEDYQGAVADFDQAIALRSDYANAYDNRATAKNQLQDFSGAISDWEKGLELNPKLKDDIQPQIDQAKAQLKQ